MNTEQLIESIIDHNQKHGYKVFEVWLDNAPNCSRMMLEFNKLSPYPIQKKDNLLILPGPIKVLFRSGIHRDELKCGMADVTFFDYRHYTTRQGYERLMRSKVFLEHKIGLSGVL